MFTLPSPFHPMSSEDISKIAGPLLIGYLLHWALFGALSVQVYIYYLAFPLDPLKRKALVYIIYIVEFIQAILMLTMAFREFAAGFGNFLVLEAIGLIWFAIPILSSVVAAAVQIFYACRIKALSGSIFLSILVVLIALVQLGGGIALGVLFDQRLTFSGPLDTKILIAAGIWNSSSALCDVVIAASMTYYLYRRKPQWKLTQRRVQKVMRLTLETGTLTAAVAFVNFLSMFIMPSHPHYQTTSLILGKMYSTMMMVLLNSRIVFSRNDITSHELSSVSHQEPVFCIVHGGITVTREPWSDPPDGHKLSDTNQPATVPDDVRAASNAYAQPEFTSCIDISKTSC